MGQCESKERDFKEQKRRKTLEIRRIRKKDFRSKILKSTEKKQSKNELIEKRSNEAVVHLHANTQHTWPHFYAYLSSILCPFCIFCHPQLGQVEQSTRNLSTMLRRFYHRNFITGFIM
jgi:hypothetical protein